MATDDKGKGLFSLPTMVRWFSPSLLANAAARSVLSPIFGTFADARGAQAAVDGFLPETLRKVVQRHDLRDAGLTVGDGAVWVDYIADTGDGFDATYAVASTAAQDQLAVARRGAKERYDLPSGKILILGGDQVYPYPTRDEYRDRFAYPFSMAYSDLSNPRMTFAIPGNHDWYDGLNSFDFLACQARYGQDQGTRVGSLIFSQHRSYFAIRLPYNWWIWGADIQFSPYLDAGQAHYFRAVARCMQEEAAADPDEPEHKIILCVAAPGWQYEEKLAREANSNIRMMAEIAADGGAKICAVISGDSHHYARYHSAELGLNLVTAGGGGAFLHSTHQLQSKIRYPWLGGEHEFDLKCRPSVHGPNVEPEVAVFPSRSSSFWLTWRNLLFPVWNYTFATLLGTFYWLMTWMYSQTPIVNRGSCSVNGRPPLVEDILVYHRGGCDLQGDTAWARLGDLATITVQAGIYQFLLGILGLGMLLILIAYADARSRWKRILMGTLHWFAHICAMVALYIGVNLYGYWEWFGDWTVTALTPFLGASVLLVRTLSYMAQMVLGGGFVAGLVWGLYLFITCAFFKRHWNDAFSALRIGDYKNFLRMKLERDRMTIFPIGIKRTPSRIEWSWRKGEGAHKGRYVPLIKMTPLLIDGPVVIDAADVRKGVDTGQRGIVI